MQLWLGVEKGREKRLALFYKGDLSLNRSLSGGEKCTAIGLLYGEGGQLGRLWGAAILSIAAFRRLPEMNEVSLPGV